MKRPDVSIVLNLHREGVYLRRTLLSLDKAVQFASCQGVTVELIVILDRADETTSIVMNDHDLSNYTKTKILSVDNGSLGLSRNDGINAATGEYIMTADGDDLVSQNFIFETFSSASSGPQNALYFPEFLFGFGANYYINVYYPLQYVTPLAFIDRHPYISRVCAHHSVFKKLMYEDLRLTSGYAYEDWHFNANAVANGLDIRVVSNTILFYRQRQGSLLQQANSVSSKQISFSNLFRPEVYVNACKGYTQTVFNNSDTGSIVAHPSISEVLNRPDIRREINLANNIDPSISIKHYNNVYPFNNVQYPINCGIAYFRACSLIEDLEFDDVFLFPFISAGGAERYFIEILNSMYRIAPERNVLLLIGEDFDGQAWDGNIPPNVVVLDLSLLDGWVSMDSRCIITLKFLQSCCAEARVHIRQSTFGHEVLKKFAAILRNHEVFYYRFCDTLTVEGDAVVVQYSPLNLISDHFDSIMHIVTDNQAIAQNDVERLGLSAKTWKVLPAPIYVAPNQASKENGPLDQILWASRLDHQKRPELLPAIAKILNATGRQLSITSYGSSVFGDFPPSIFDQAQNLRYAGPFEGFGSIPIFKYGIFIYTSWYDGVPNVLLEAMANGLVVIAPDVGGVSEIIIDRQTGILLPSLTDQNSMARLYADAILELQSDPEFASDLIRNARQLLIEQRSYDAYDKKINLLYSCGVDL